MTPRSLHVQLFGGCAVLHAGEPIASLRSARLQALLAHLLLHRGTPQPRQRLAFLFWPESSDAQAQTNLRQLLHTLRQRVPDASAYMMVDEYAITWRSDVPIVLDVALFEEAVEKAAAGATRIEALESAVALYSGDLLPTCVDDWIRAPRERLAQMFIGALEQLVALHEERRDYATAITHAHRLLRHDPLHESTYRHLIRLYALGGDRAAALRVYHTCATLLEREFGVAPSQSTQGAYARLLQADSASRARHVEQSPFVGRQVEWQLLLAQWKRAVDGGLRVVCIKGDAGVGKTRLADELLHWAQQQGIDTLHAQTFAAGTSTSYAPLVECMRNAAVQPVLARLAPVWRTELARLMPELLAADPALPRPEPLTQPWQRQRLFDALARALVPERDPLILVLDDLQWCDVETLDWLLYLSSRRDTDRLLLVTTARSDELLPDHPATGFLLELSRLDLLRAVHLPALDRAETSALAAGIAGTPLDSAMAQQLYAATEGNPLFIVETMRSQAIDEERGMGAARLPFKVYDVIRARLAHLSPPARNLASLAATIGRSFETDVLLAACDLDEAMAVQGLDELWQRRIVDEQGISGYDFSHDCLREVAYADLEPAQRRQLHARVAHALERVQPTAAGVLNAQVAYHYEQAGDIERAVHFLQQAALTARQIYAQRGAIAHLERAIALVQAHPAGPASLERELALQMELCQDWGSITNYLGAEARAVYERALVLSRRLHDSPHLFTVYWGLHEVALYCGRFAESLELAQQCLRIAEQVSNIEQMLQAHHALWGVYHFSGKHDEALTHMEAGLALYRYPVHETLSAEYGLHDAACCALGTSALSLWQLGLLDQAVQRQKQLAEHASRLAQPANRADGYGGVALLYHLLRAPGLAHPYAESMMRTGVELGYPGLHTSGAIALGWSLAMQGRSGEGLPMIEQGIAREQTAGFQLNQSHKFVMLAEAYLAAGHPVAARQACEQGIDALAHYREGLCAPDLWTIKGAALAALNAPDAEIAACYDRALALARELGAKTSELCAVVHLARLRQRQGRSAEALASLRQVYDSFSEGFGTPDLLAAKALIDALEQDISSKGTDR